jgi:hypothetical protein
LKEYRDVPSALASQGKITVEQFNPLIAGIAAVVATASMVRPRKKVKVCRDASVPEPIPSDGLPFPSKIPSTAEEKVALFRSLFRGREDVFPKLWENAKTNIAETGISRSSTCSWVRSGSPTPAIDAPWNGPLIND